MRRYEYYGRTTGFPPRSVGLGAAPVAASAISSVPTPNVDAQRYIEGRRMFYIYQTPNVASIAAAASATNTIQFDIDSVFCWLRICVFADIAGAVQTVSSLVVPLVTMQVTDTGSGTNFFNNPIPLGAIAGSAQLPFVMPSPQFVQPAASLQFAFANFSNATTYANLRVQLIGFKVYGSQPPAQLG